MILNHQPPGRNVLGHPPVVRPTPRGAGPPAPSFPFSPVCSLVLAGDLAALGCGVEGGLAPSSQVGGRGEAGRGLQVILRSQRRARTPGGNPGIGSAQLWPPPPALPLSSTEPPWAGPLQGLLTTLSASGK